MEAGKLRNRVTVERPAAARDDYGQSDGWETVLADVPAEIMPISGREKLRAMAVESTLSTRVRVRYAATLMPPLTADAWRIKYGDRLFNITAALPDARRTEIVFECTEGSLDGQ